MKKNDDNLNLLLLQFMDEAQAQRFQDDLSVADDLYDSHPAEPVSPNTVSAISTQIQHELKRRHIWTIAEWCTAAAAVVVMALLAGLFLLNSSPSANQLPAGGFQTANAQIWSDTPIANAIETDPIEQELSALTKDIQSMSLDAYGSTNALTVDLLEIEEIEAFAEDTSFWKG